MLSLSGLVALDVQVLPAPARTEAAAPAAGPFAELCRFLCWAALYGIVVVTVVRPADDWDLWWHLRTGEWIAANGQVPQTDPFSQYGQGRPWVAYSWLFEVLLYGLHQVFGLYGIVLLRAMLSLAVIAAFHRFISKRVSSFFAAVGLLTVVIVVCLPLLSERPWLFSVLFTVLTLDVVLDLHDGKRTRLTWLLPLLFALWANLHIQFVYGLALLGLACVAPLIDRLRAGPDGPTNKTAIGSPAWWRLLALTAGCTLATLVNPYHMRLYAVVLEYGTQTGAFRLVQELSALEFRDLCSWVTLALALASAFALGRRRYVSAFDALLLAGAAYLAFRARRDVWFLSLVAIAVLSRSVSSAVADRFVWTMPRRLVLGALIVVIGAAAGLVRCGTREHMEAVVAARFPAQAAAAVERAGCAGPLYNSFDWGGYLIWRLPQLPVSIDGRTNLHGDERLQRSFDTWRGASGWHDDPELAAANLIIADAGCPLASLLRQDMRFEIIHEDAVAIVFRRIPQAAPSNLPSRN